MFTKLALPEDLIVYMLSYTNPVDRAKFEKTCKGAEKLLFKLNEIESKEMGIPDNEINHYYLQSKLIRNLFPPFFKDLTSPFYHLQLQLLLSSNGMTYQKIEGILKNVKCVFDPVSSVLLIKIYSATSVAVYSL